MQVVEPRLEQAAEESNGFNKAFPRQRDFYSHRYHPCQLLERMRQKYVLLAGYRPWQLICRQVITHRLLV